MIKRSSTAIRNKKANVDKNRSKILLARQYFKAGKTGKAALLYKSIAKSDRENWESRQMMGTIAWMLNNAQQAEFQFREALRIRPDHHEVHFQLGSVLLATNHTSEALACFQRAIEIKPDFPEPYISLGNAFASGGKLQQASELYSKVLEINPNHTIAQANLGNILAGQGRLTSAIAAWRKALSISPDYQSAYSNLLLCLNYSPLFSADMIFKEHLLWAETYRRSVKHFNSYSGTPDPGRRIRIGYVTADLKEHSVAYFLKPILKYHNTDEYAVYCYSDAATPDETTKELQSLIKYNRNSIKLSNKELAALVNKDGIDILVDLAGHTCGNRLQLFAYKPAPVQVTYLGYPNTTGLPEMDYRLTDESSDPTGTTEKYYTETLYRLPKGFLCYAPPQDIPSAPHPPVKQAGHVTFGAFNYIGKTTSEVIEAWAGILQKLPDAKLIMKNKSLSDNQTCEDYFQLFSDYGISRDRIEMIGLTLSKKEHMSAYGRVDIALDTFPYNGTTTTCDSLWMGVPVITLLGKNHAGRVGHSILSGLGLDRFVASSLNEYINIAVQLASDRNEVCNLHANTRNLMMNSYLCDGKRFTRNLEQAYRNMWTMKCSKA